MNNRILYFLTLTLFIFSFTNESKDHSKLNLFNKNEGCRISKIYLNSELDHQFHYDENNRKIKSEYFYGKSYHFSTADYNHLGRLIESNLYYTRVGNLSLKPDSSNLIQSRFKAEFKYQKDKKLINEVRYYRGNSILLDEDVEDENLEYYQKAKYFYDSNDKLIEIILGKKKRKSVKVLVTLDDRNNPILLEYFENRKNGKLYKSVEREFDTSPKIYLNLTTDLFFIGSRNNHIYRKTTHFPLNNINKKNRIEEEKFDYIYDNRGFVSERSFKGRDSLMSFYNYEYICD